MSIEIQLKNRFLDSAPDNSTLAHLTILCGALKYCLGSAKKMSFIKLAYIFDKTINLEENAFSSKITLSTWNVDSDFKKSLIIAESNGLVNFFIDSNKKVRISLASKGVLYLGYIEDNNIFINYINYLKEINISENRFDNLVIRS